MKLAALLLAVGVALIAYAASLLPYKDGEQFTQRYHQLSAGQSAEYHALRGEMLTPKYLIEDYGATAIALAMAIFLSMRSGRLRIDSPRSPRTLAAIGVGLPFLTVAGSVSDLLLGFSRGEFPHWADSMSIPLMGTPVVLVVTLIWALAHLRFLRGVAYLSTPLIRAVSPKANWWLLLMSAASAVLTIESLVFGHFCYFIPSATWLYFYLSLAAVRREAQDDEEAAAGPASPA